MDEGPTNFLLPSQLGSRHCYLVMYFNFPNRLEYHSIWLAGNREWHKKSSTYAQAKHEPKIDE